jgi:hypothetical protein
VVAIVALLLAVPMERGRVCNVCPVDCPMHGAHRAAGHVGCHHAAETAHAADPDGGCAMRAGCGHHDSSTLIAFHAELPLVPVHVGVDVRRLTIVVPVAHGIAVSAPQPHPPESVVV